MGGISSIKFYESLQLGINTDLLVLLLALVAHWLIILLFTLSFIAHYEYQSPT